MRSRSLALMMLSCMALAPPAGAGEWTTNAGLVNRLQYTDNLFLTPDNEQSDFILQVIPVVSAERTGGRASARFRYGPSISMYLDESDLNRVDHVLQANAEAELVQNVFFLRGRATANQALIAPTQRSSGFSDVDTLANPDAFSQYFTLAVAPSLQFPIGTGRYARMSLETDVSYVYTEDTADSRTDDGAVDIRSSARIASGPFFTRMPWSIGYRSDIFDTDQDDGYSRLDGQVSYRFSRRYLGTVRLGYDEGDYQSSSDSSGFGWQVGFTWTPSPRTTLSAGVGEAYFGDDSYLDLQHRHKRTVWRARYGVSVEDFRRSLLQQEVIPATDSFGNPIVDPFSREVVNTIRNTSALVDEIYVRQQLTTSVATSRRRTSARLLLDVAQDTYEQGTNPTRTSFQALLDLSRRLTPKTSASLLLTYWDNSQDAGDGVGLNNADFDQYGVSVALTRSLGPRTTAALIVGHVERNDESDLDSFEENRITATLSMRLK